MKIGILQPGYLPWLGFFEQLYRTDLFVLYDDVQYDKHGWRNRNRIKTAQGIQWLTVPVLHKFSDKSPVSAIQINNQQPWAKKHLTSIQHAYGKAPFFKSYFSVFEEVYAQSWEYLADLDIHFIQRIAAMLGLGYKTLVRSSELNLTQTGKQERLVEICQHFGAHTFYEGAAGKNYIDTGLFAANGVAVKFQDYHHPVYAQLHGEFQPYLSIVDLVFNQGPLSLATLIGNTHPL